MARPAETRAKRRSTLAMITRDGQEIALFRANGSVQGGYVDDGEGGQIPAPAAPGEDPDEPVSIKQRYFTTVVAEPVDETTDQGERLLINFVLIGKWDDDIREGDWFYVKNERYQIEFVDPNQDYQTKGVGVAYSSGNASAA